MKSSILGLTSDLHYYFYQEPIRMNIGLEGLIGIVINEFGMDPRNSDVYVFVSRSHKLLKLLHYHDGIFTLYINTSGKYTTVLLYILIVTPHTRRTIWTGHDSDDY
jgi:hypothetical protein